MGLCGIKTTKLNLEEWLVSSYPIDEEEEGHRSKGAAWYIRKLQVLYDGYHVEKESG